MLVWKYLCCRFYLNVCTAFTCFHCAVQNVVHEHYVHVRYMLMCMCYVCISVRVFWLPIKDRDWTDYWRILFKKVTVDDIIAFEKSYKGSEEESETLRSAYVDCEGDMDKILEKVCELYHSVYTSV